jgi:O-antigen ligase
VPPILPPRIIFVWLNFLITALLLTGIGWIQIQLGGTRPAHAYPGYLLVGCAGLLSVLAFGFKRSAPNWGTLLWTSLFFGYLLIRTWLSPLQFLANTNLFLILAALTTYFLSAALLTELRWRLFLIGGFLLLEIGHLWVGIIQYVAGANFLPFGYVRPDYGLRASGFYVCPNHFAGFLESLALLVLALALFARLQVWIRIVLIYLATAGFAGVLISGSRGGYLSSGAGLVVLVIYGFYHSFRVAPSRVQQVLLSAICIGGLVLLIGSIFVIRSELLTQRFGSVIEPRDLRPRLWQAALREFALDPVVGTGAGTYLIYGRKFRDPSIQSDPIYAHNDYVQLLAEYGVIGEALFVGFLAAHLSSAWKFIRRMLRWLQQNEKTFSSSLGLAVGASLGVVALMVHSFFDFNLQIPGNTLFVAFLFGILANPGVQWDKEQPEPRTNALIWRLVPVLLGLVLIGFVWPRWPGEAESEAARLAFLKQSYALAIYHSIRAIQHGNENPDTLYYLAESRRQLGNGFSGDTKRDFLTGAAKAFQQGLDYFPMDERLLVKGGLTLAQLGDFTGADDLFARAFEWSPNLGQVYAFYGSRLQLEGRSAEAATAYRHSNQLSANQIATVGLNQTLEAAKIAQPTLSPTP